MPNLQGPVASGAWATNPLDIDCKSKGFTDCEKKQICAKCKSINRQAKKGKLKRRTPKQNKKLKNKKRYAQKKQRQEMKKELTNGTMSEQEIKASFAHPCAYEKWKNGGRPADMHNPDFDPDHVHEVQLGGHVSSPSNFKWMSSNANQWMGSTLTKYETSGPNKHTGVKPNCC